MSTRRHSGPSVDDPLANLVMLLLAGLFLAVAVFGQPVRARGVESSLMVIDPRSDEALFGFDPVAYFVDGAAREGDPAVTVVWQGLIWRFTGQANRDAFVESPESYVPRFYGNDPVAVAQGMLTPGDPATFAIVDGRVHLFRSPDRRDVFVADRALQTSAGLNWPKARLQAGH